MRRVLLGLVILVLSCTTTITRRDGTKVSIPAGGFIGSMAAANIACQDTVQTLAEENARLKARIAELERQLADQKRGPAAAVAPTPQRPAAPAPSA